MKNKITIREAVTENDVELFWEQLCNYFKRDMFPDPNDGTLNYFLSSEYRTLIQKTHERTQNQCQYLFFHKEGQDIGFAMPVIFTSEDGKCFVMEFCVYPEYRGNGTGKECAKVLLSWAKEKGAHYTELSYGSDERRLRFWKSVGFIENGVNDSGEPWLILPPEEEIPIKVEILTDPADWQLLKLENGFKKDIGEEILTEEQINRLQQAIREGKITIFVAKRDYRAVGMCSVSKCYSGFTCSDMGVYDDYYVEPAFRGKGIARKLRKAAQTWCKDNGISSLMACRPHVMKNGAGNI